MPTTTIARGYRATPDGNIITNDAHSRLTQAVVDTFGADAPAECFTIALDFYDDAYRHAQHIRAIDGYKRPLSRADVLEDAVASIRAC